MCGIVGVITKASNGFVYPQQDVLSEMLVTDAIRGEDSTGVFSVNRSGNADFVKLASHPFNLLKSIEYKEWHGKLWNSGKMAVGHNRKATQGAISNANAHPFAFGPVLLVHNGNVENFRSLLHHKEREKQGINVDSHVVAALFAREEPLKVIPEIKGAYVFVWYNAVEKRLHIVRNSERPLSLVDTKDGIFFASEKGLLRWLLRRRGIDAEIAEVKPGVLLSCDLDNKWENRPVQVYEKPIVVTQPTNHRPVSNTAPGTTLALPMPPPEHEIRQPQVRMPIKQITQMPIEDSFNIHYGDDQYIDLDNVKFPQIVFTVDDFKRVSEDHVEPPIWKLWGPALESKSIHVTAQFRGSEDDCEKLAYSEALVCHITRVSDKGQGVEDRYQMVYGVHPRMASITNTPNRVPIIREHMEYLTEKVKCTCGHVDPSTIDAEDRIFIRRGFQTSLTCAWCMKDTPECMLWCTQPGKCQCCQSSEKNETTPPAAVQAGK